MDIGSLKEQSLAKAREQIAGMSPLEKLRAGLPKLSLASLSSMLAAFASAFTQDNRLVKLQIGDGRDFNDRLLPQDVKATEGLSACYQYEVTCLSPDAFIPVEELLGQSAQLDIITGVGLFSAAPQNVT
ncbi:MAG: hypothetical protein LBP99_06450, partial [Azoarcus sp.]|nr:hypothetical protein [Azoarcus sp.]